MADTPEELKKLAAQGTYHAHRSDTYDPSCVYCKQTMSKLKAAYALGLSDMQERACKTVCDGCAKGWPLEDGSHIWHVDTSLLNSNFPKISGVMMCKAAAIRALPKEG